MTAMSDREPLTTSSMDRRQFTAGLLTTIAVRPTSLLNLTACAPQRAIEPPSAAFLAGLPRLMEIAGVPAVGMAVVQNGRVAWTNYSGVGDITANQPVNAETIWPAASLSKPVFAYAALHLVDQGKLDLDKPLKMYVPDHAPDDPRGNTITTRHVLSHSSGLRNWRQRLDQPLVPDFEPGSRFQYSGEGFYYLQRAVEHIAQMGFERFMEERVFNPLGMKSSTYFWRPDVGPRLVTGYDRGQPSTSFGKDMGPRLIDAALKANKEPATLTYEDTVALMATMNPAPAIIPNAMIPNCAGSLLTTPAEYGAFLVQLLKEDSPSLRLMRAKQSTINSALGWALGIGVEQQRDGEDGGYLWHWGDNGAWKNFVLIHPPTKSAIVVFTNGSKGLNVANQIVTAATGEPHAAFLWL